jgi:mono/diheme cytochrome c family protein
MIAFSRGAADDSFAAEFIRRMDVKRSIQMFLLAIVLLLPVLVFAQERGGGRGAAPARNPNPPTSPVTGNAANGKPLYYNHGCYGCHGFNGETGRAFVGNWTSNLASEENFIRFLRARANVAPATPSTSMPNFPENSLNDKQAKDIYAYIRTFKSNAPPLQSIPTLNEIVKAASRPYKP